MVPTRYGWRTVVESIAKEIASSGKLREFHPVHPTEAIIIRLTRLTENSLIVHWLSGEHGLIKTVAHGARQPKSAFAGRIDLFFGGEMMFRRARKGDLHALREVVIRDWREGLRRTYTSTLLAGYCCQLIEAAVEPEHPDADFYDLLKRALDYMASEPPSLRALRHFEAELARLLGVFHSLAEVEMSLRETLGFLPNTRRELLDRLAGS